MEDIIRKNVITPAGIELTLEAEKKIEFKPEHRILSVGCGSGDIESYLSSKYGCRILGIDSDPEAINLAKKKSNSILEFRQESGEDIKEVSGSFDIAFSCGSLGYFLDNGVKEISRLLKNGGIAIVIEATYLENTIPEDLLESIVQRNKFNVVNLVTMERIISRFRLVHFSGTFSRIYFEPLWWRNYACEEGDSVCEKDTGRIYEIYKRHLGFGLFLFRKEPDDYII